MARLRQGGGEHQLRSHRHLPPRPALPPHLPRPLLIPRPPVSPLLLSCTQAQTESEREIHRAVATLVPPDERQADSVDVRQEIDLRLGAAFTRFLTLRYQPMFQGLKDVILSYG
jgi:hypothetical protein